MLPPAFSAGIVLLLSAWKGKKSGFVSKDLDLVYSCIQIAKEAEERHLSAGRYTDFMSQLLYAGEVDSLYEIDSVDVPPSAQRNYGAFVPPQSFDADLDSHWSSTFIQDELHAMLNPRLGIPEYQSENGLAMFPGMGVDGSYNHPDRIYDFEQPSDVDRRRFPAEMSALWSTVPTSFDVEDWSYILAKEPQSFNQFSSAPDQTYIKDPKQDEQLRREWSGFWG
ncbi:hypothetical protein B0H19DRAFT_56860 [Mycena capillaripes]|nr:hypothetical protein B0H19DRAFT_56860 [Mycena capillaripes]